MAEQKYEQGGWYEGKQYWNGTFSEKGQIHPESDQAGAGQMVSKEVVDQTNPANWEYLHGNSQQPSSQDQVTPYLNNYQNSLFASAGAVATKIPTMEELKSDLSPSTTQPALLNRNDELTKLREQYGVAGLESQLNDLTAQEDDEVAFFRQQRFDEKGKPVAMGVIQGRISEEEQAANERLDAIGRQKSRIIDQLQTTYAMIDTYMTNLGLDYQDAVTQYNQEFSNNLQMYNIILGRQDQARSEYESDRAMASANLATYTNLITSGNLNYSSLSSDQKLMINKLEVQSGMPMGTISQLQMNAGDKILQFNDKTGEALIVGAGGNLEVIQTGMRRTPDSVSSTSDSKATLQRFKADASNDSTTFYSLVENYANSMTLEQIYEAWNNSENGQKFGPPNEDSRIIKYTYLVAKGEMSEEDAILELSGVNYGN